MSSSTSSRAVDGAGERGDGVSPSGGAGTEAPVEAPTPIPSSGVDGKGSRSLSALSLLAAASSYLLSL